jgi:hypothetical protein
MGNCCKERRKQEGFNATEVLVLEKLRLAKETIIEKFPEIGSLKFIEKIEHVKSIENISNSLIVMATVLEDDLIEGTKTLDQNELNKIYEFLLELEFLNSMKIKDFEKYQDLFEENEDLYEKLNINFKVPRSVKFNSSMSTDIDESLIEQPSKDKKK